MLSLRSRIRFRSQFFRHRPSLLSSADILQTRRRGFRCGRPQFFLRIFRNLWCVSSDKGRRRVEPVRTFSRQGGGVNFSRFCVDLLYGRPLTLCSVCSCLIKISCNLKGNVFVKRTGVYMSESCLVSLAFRAATRKHTMVGQKYFKGGNIRLDRAKIY